MIVNVDSAVILNSIDDSIKILSEELYYETKQFIIAASNEFKKSRMYDEYINEGKYKDLYIDDISKFYLSIHSKLTSSYLKNMKMKISDVSRNKRSADRERLLNNALGNVRFENFFSLSLFYKNLEYRNNFNILVESYMDISYNRQMPSNIINSIYDNYDFISNRSTENCDIHRVTMYNDFYLNNIFNNIMSNYLISIKNNSGEILELLGKFSNILANEKEEYDLQIIDELYKRMKFSLFKNYIQLFYKVNTYDKNAAGLRLNYKKILDKTIHETRFSEPVDKLLHNLKLNLGVDSIDNEFKPKYWSYFVRLQYKINNTVFSLQEMPEEQIDDFLQFIESDEELLSFLTKDFKKYLASISYYPKEDLERNIDIINKFISINIARLNEIYILKHMVKDDTKPEYISALLKLIQITMSDISKFVKENERLLYIYNLEEYIVSRYRFYIKDSESVVINNFNKYGLKELNKLIECNSDNDNDYYSGFKQIYPDFLSILELRKEDIYNNLNPNLSRYYNTVSDKTLIKDLLDCTNSKLIYYHFYVSFYIDDFLFNTSELTSIKKIYNQLKDKTTVSSIYPTTRIKNQLRKFGLNTNVYEHLPEEISEESLPIFDTVKTKFNRFLDMNNALIKNFEYISNEDLSESVYNVIEVKYVYPLYDKEFKEKQFASEKAIIEKFF